MKHVAERPLENVVGSDRPTLGHFVHRCWGLKIEHADLSLFAERGVDTLKCYGCGVILNVEEWLMRSESGDSEIGRIKRDVVNCAKVHLADYRSGLEARGARIDNENAPTGKSSVRNDGF